MNICVYGAGAVGGSIDTFPDTLNRLFSGANFGKLVLKVADG